LPTGGLFTPRPIKMLDDIHPMFGHSVYLRMARKEVAEWRSDLTNHGAEVTSTGLAQVSRGKPYDFDFLDRWLPFIAKRAPVPIIGDMIPPPAFGANLSQILVASSWLALKDAVRATTRTEGRCEMCGSAHSLAGHELWEYHEPLDGGPGVQRLTRIIPVCAACHETHHLAFASSQGRGEIALERLAACNRWSFDEAHDYAINFLQPRLDRRFEEEWVIDVTAISKPNQVLLVQKSWNFDRKYETLWKEVDEEWRYSLTRILGAPWRFVADGRDSPGRFADPRSYYHGGPEVMPLGFEQSAA
jgi:hypothetical protein